MLTPLDQEIRKHLANALMWEDAHVGFEAAVADIPEMARGKTPPGLPYSPWQLLEHLRRTQHDILDFCRNPDYVELKWPDDYWPESAAPPSASAWDGSITAFLRDRAALQKLAADPDISLASTIPHGKGQTYLRELLLVTDHSAYHLGELVIVRRLLGIWT
jgi:DinB superfamily